MRKIALEEHFLPPDLGLLWARVAFGRAPFGSARLSAI